MLGYWNDFSIPPPLAVKYSSQTIAVVQETPKARLGDASLTTEWLLWQESGPGAEALELFYITQSLNKVKLEYRARVKDTAIKDESQNKINFRLILEVQLSPYYTTLIRKLHSAIIRLFLFKAYCLHREIPKHILQILTKYLLRVTGSLLGYNTNQ